MKRKQLSDIVEYELFLEINDSAIEPSFLIEKIDMSRKSHQVSTVILLFN